MLIYLLACAEPTDETGDSGAVVGATEVDCSYSSERLAAGWGGTIDQRSIQGSDGLWFMVSGDYVTAEIFDVIDEASNYGWASTDVSLYGDGDRTFFIVRGTDPQGCHAWLHEE